jgi:hypothetical protein
MPLAREENGRVQVLRFCTFRLYEKKLMVEGIITVECDPSAFAAGSPVAWQIVRIDLVRAKRPPPGRPGMPGTIRGPRPPGGPEMPGELTPKPGGL